MTEYEELYESLKSSTSGENRHHFRLRDDPLRDDDDWVYCTWEEHCELHRLMFQENPCHSTSAAYNRIRGSKKGIESSKTDIARYHRSISMRGNKNGVGHGSTRSHLTYVKCEKNGTVKTMPISQAKQYKWNIIEIVDNPYEGWSKA